MLEILITWGKGAYQGLVLTCAFMYKRANFSPYCNETPNGSMYPLKIGQVLNWIYECEFWR